MISYSGKYRKGKPIGLPYQGSKKKISRQIVEIIKENFGTDKKVYDLFGGGGAMSCELLLQGYDVVYNEIKTDVYEMFKKSLELTEDEIKTFILSRDEFFEIRAKKVKSPIDNLKLLINSFGNDRDSYLYSVEKSELKYKVALEILEKEKDWRKYKQTDVYKSHVGRLINIERLQQLQALERLVQLSRVKKIGEVKSVNRLGHLETHNKDYRAFSHVEGAILYLDPPYENTSGYVTVKSDAVSKDEIERARKILKTRPKGTKLRKGTKVYSINDNGRVYVRETSNGFNSKIFYDWAYEMSKKNIVLISSYEISDPRFKCVWTFEKAGSTLAGGTDLNKKERLFMICK